MMKFEITSGVIPSAKKVVVYGPEGIGKSTFAAEFPDSLFIDTEGSTKHMNVKRLPSPENWQMLMDEIAYVTNTPGICKTLVIDTADWAEKLAMPYVIQKYGGGDPRITSLESFGFGKGFTFLEDEFKKFIDSLSKLVETGVNVVVTAHSTIRTFTEPDGFGQYDRYELKLSKKCSPILKEWADILLFANYKTIIVKDTNGKQKGQGGQRIMYSTHTPAWDAKNRFGLPNEMPFEFKSIASIIPTELPVTVPTEPQTLDLNEPHQDIYEPETAPVEETPLSKLRLLLQKRGITDAEIEDYVGKTGAVPEGTKLADYDAELLAFLTDNIGAVYSKIVEIRDPLG